MGMDYMEKPVRQLLVVVLAFGAGIGGAGIGAGIELGGRQSREDCRSAVLTWLSV